MTVLTDGYFHGYLTKKFESASKKANDREILESFFRHHNLTPSYYYWNDDEKLREKEVKFSKKTIYANAKLLFIG